MINLRNESSKQLTLAETEKKYSKTQFYIMHFVDQVIIKTKILWDFMLGWPIDSIEDECHYHNL